MAELKQEKEALKRKVAELKEDNEDLNADGETLQVWGNELRTLGRMIEKDFENLYQDIKEKKSLFEPGTDHTDNCDVSVHVLNYGLSIKIVNLQAIAMGMCIQKTSGKPIEPKGACSLRMWFVYESLTTCALIIIYPT